MTRRRRLARALLLLATIGAWLALAAARGGYFDPPRRGAFEVRARDLVVLDGDTLLHEGREVRFLAVDTPERAAPWFDDTQEPWASRAKALVTRALRRARRVTVLLSGIEDVHGRRLGHVLVDDRPLAVLLVEAGLAYETVSRYGDSGYPEIAAEVVARARKDLPFEAPWRWRAAHRRSEGAPSPNETRGSN
jgi:endonuclease YncB( thermonuclease family)